MNTGRLILSLFVLIAVFAFGYFYGIGSCFKIDQFKWNFLMKTGPSSRKSSSSLILFEGLTKTHLWSMRLADENHYRLARLLPCRNVSYTGGPKVDQIDTCDFSSTNEFSVENTIQAQTWIFQHQNPSNCSEKRFAVIDHHAWSGFGSVAHQVVWAFGMALAENRIAVYKKPSNWVNGKHSFVNHFHRC